MKITLVNGKELEAPWSAIASQGYAARTIMLEANDIFQMRRMAQCDPKGFQAAMLQFEHRLRRAEDDTRVSEIPLEFPK